MADVFISYASEDRDRVRPLAEALQARGFSVWWDRSLVAGDDFASVIQRELDAAKAVIVVWSQTSGASPWVRDEAGRAREGGRLVPVLLDKVEIPLGFGQIHTEDLSAWNGAPNAAQIELLSDALKVRIAGGGVDPEAVAAKRKRLMSRIRVVSVLSVLAAVVGIGAGVTTIINNTKPKPPPPAVVQPVDTLAQLLKLVEEGKISGEEAVRLAELLQKQAFADVPASSSAPGVETKAAEAGPTDAAVRSMSASLAPEAGAAVEVASATFDESARAMFSEATAQLIQDPDARVRSAVLRAALPATRAQGLEEMWKIAAEGGPSAGIIYRACGALMAATNDPRAADALERARALNPQDKRVWRMLAVAYGRDAKPEAAAGAALVGEGLDAAAQGKREEAAKTLETALPYVEQKPDEKAFVLGQLGDAAAAQNDWNAAERRYKEAVRLQTLRKDVGAIGLEAAKLARAHLAQGEKRDACRTLERARDAGATVSAEEMQSACAAPEPALVQPRAAPPPLPPGPLPLTPPPPRP